MIEKLLDDLLGIHLLGFGLVTDHQTVSQDIGSDCFDIIWRYIAAPADKSMGTRGAGQETI